MESLLSRVKEEFERKLAEQNKLVSLMFMQNSLYGITECLVIIFKGFLFSLLWHDRLGQLRKIKEIHMRFDCVAFAHLTF